MSPLRYNSVDDKLSRLFEIPADCRRRLSSHRPKLRDATRRDATRQFLRVVSGGVNIDAANLLHQSVRPPVVRFPQQCVPFSINTLSLSRLRVPICAGKLSARETQLAFAEDRELSRGR